MWGMRVRSNPGCTSRSLLPPLDSSNHRLWLHLYKRVAQVQTSWQNCVFLSPNVRDLFLSSPLTTSLLMWLQSGWPSAAWLQATVPGPQRSQGHTVILSQWDIAPDSAQVQAAHPHMVSITPAMQKRCSKGAVYRLKAASIDHKFSLIWNCCLCFFSVYGSSSFWHICVCDCLTKVTFTTRSFMSS